MKKIFNLAFASLLFIAAGQVTAQTVIEDDVTMGAQYANDVFYSMENGTVGTAPRDNWDIAFKTTQIDATVIINDGSNVKLYTYPDGDINDFDDVNNDDIADIENWKAQYNSVSEWVDGGAFNAYATEDIFDYGWGTYNMANHKVTGDSLYIIQLGDGSYKKLKLIEKDAMPNIYRFAYANMDGTNLVEKSIEVNNYASKKYVYYSLATNEVLDREPVGEYDMVFTKYISMIFDGTNYQPYPVTGVLLVEGAEASKYTEVDQATFKTYVKEDFEAVKNKIGHDWKTFNMGTYTYDVADDIVYFVLKDNIVHKLYFTAFSSAEGKTTLKKEDLGNVAVKEIKDSELFSTYPNPCNAYFNINTSSINREVNVKVIGSNGQVIEQKLIPANSNETRIETKSMPSGLYMILLEDGKDVYSAKMLKK